MLGVLVNVIAVILGSSLGLLFKKGISQKFTSAVMTGVGLVVIYLGVQNILVEEANALAIIVGMVIGALCGTAIGIDDGLNSLGEKLEKKAKGGKISEGFVTASLLFCVGAMTITGSIEAGNGDNTVLFTKSILDFISASMLTASLGAGVMFSALFVLVFQGALVLLSGVISSFLTGEMMGTLIATGGILIIALGLNLLKITKIKVADYLPALLFAPIIAYIFAFIL